MSILKSMVRKITLAINSFLPEQMALSKVGSRVSWTLPMYSIQSCDGVPVKARVES